MDSKIKQRCVGAIVLIGLAVIFIPVLFSNSAEFTRAFESPSKVPAQPKQPQISVKQIQEQNNKIATQIAKVEAPTKVVKPVISHVNQVAHVEPSSKQKILPTKKATSAKIKLSQTKVTNKTKIKKIPALNSWVVQLASFTSKQHADNLVKKLRKQNYASFIKPIVTKKGKLYRVFVGPLPKRQDAESVLKQVATTTKLKGFVVAYKAISLAKK